MTTMRDLQDFLVEAQLDHYLNALRNELKITCIEHLKYVKEEDLEGIGMAKPEMRRLKKFYKKECPQGTFGKLRKAIMRGSDGPGRSLSPSPPEHRVPRPASYMRHPGRQIIPQDAIVINKTLGEGEFGVVQQGVWTTEEGEKVQVAIKCLSKERMQNGTQEFLKEAANMQTIDNENIVRLFGVVLDKENTLMLVTELAPMRSLLECLKEPSFRLDFPISRLCDFAQQICDGMAYLESKRMIHRDLAARNILVFSKNKVKISDFGLSRALGVGKDYYQSNFSINLKLPIAWCAPECINFLKFTSASDVWAYGVTLWEMFTYGWQPWAGLTGQQILEAIDTPNCQRLDQPDLCPKDYFELMKKCWSHAPEDRPAFGQLLLKLAQIRPMQLKAVKDYPSLTVEKNHLYYKSYDIIIILDKNPDNAPGHGLWKGALTNGKCGFFDPTNCQPFIEPKTSPISLPKTSLTRKESNRKSGRKLRIDMISRPQNDLRHTGHIGYDGAVFGDVSFIGDQYDKLPTRVSGKAGEESVGSSLSSIPRCNDSPDRDGFNSVNHHTSRTNGYGHSWISQESLESQSTTRHIDGQSTPPYQDIDDDALLSDFKIPDLTSSLDFGPSFMDEVLRALDEKEKKIESTSDKASSSSGSKEDSCIKLDRSRSVSPGETDMKQSPPPLPTSPPRVEPRRSDSHPEPKKQAKVKPMSASDEKMMESAIALANEFAAQSNRSQMRDSQSPPSTPTKTEKLRTESESSSDSPNLISKIKMSMKRSPKQDRKRTFSDDLNNKGDIDEALPPEAQEAYNVLVVRGSYKDKDEVKDERRETPERSPSVSSDAVFANSSELHISETRPPPPKPVPKPRIDFKRSEIPVPKPRPEIHRVEPTLRQTNSVSIERSDHKTDSKNGSQIPVPHTSVQRQESLPETKEREREELKKTIEIVRVDLPEKKEDTPDSITEISEPPPKAKAESEKKESPVLSFFDDDFAEPSPREIMSRLARESRIRRSLDHQRGVTGDNEPPTSRNLREPQGIPGKGSTSTAAADEEEVDTNPLRMLRGGAIPIRGGRGGPGTSSKPSLRYPKLHFSNPLFQHTLSDPGGSGMERDTDSNIQWESPPSAPVLPPRTYSSSHPDSNPVPLPPRKPLRPGTLNTKPRERKYPLLLNNNSGRITTSTTVSSSSLSSSYPVHDPSPDLPPAPPPPLGHEFDLEDDNVFCSESPPNPPAKTVVNTGASKVSTFRSGKFRIRNVKCSLEQLGFYNHHDPFWVQTVILPDRNNSDHESSEEVSPLLLVNYKNSENVSYEDLLEFALDREKNCEEIETMQNLFSTELSVEECMYVLEETKWDLQKAIKYIKLKQLISTELGDINRCKDSLMKCSWDVHRAADYLLSHPLPSPESVDV